MGGCRCDAGQRLYTQAWSSGLASGFHPEEAGSIPVACFSGPTRHGYPLDGTSVAQTLVQILGAVLLGRPTVATRREVGSIPTRSLLR